MKNHTPGPWGYFKDISGYSIFSGAETIAYTVGSGSPRNMARQRSGENEATARLIAASPDLLKALKAMLDAFHEDPMQNTDRAIEMAYQAIKKAQGGA